MATDSNDKQPDRHISIADLERMTTHDIADLLSNLVLLLRRLPDVPLAHLTPLEKHYDVSDLAAGIRQDTGKTDNYELPNWIEE